MPRESLSPSARVQELMGDSLEFGDDRKAGRDALVAREGLSAGNRGATEGSKERPAEDRASNPPAGQERAQNAERRPTVSLAHPYDAAPQRDNIPGSPSYKDPYLFLEQANQMVTDYGITRAEQTYKDACEAAMRIPKENMAKIEEEMKKREPELLELEKQLDAAKKAGNPQDELLKQWKKLSDPRNTWLAPAVALANYGLACIKSGNNEYITKGMGLLQLAVNLRDLEHNPGTKNYFQKHYEAAWRVANSRRPATMQLDMPALPQPQGNDGEKPSSKVTPQETPGDESPGAGGQPPTDKPDAGPSAGSDGKPSDQSDKPADSKIDEPSDTSEDELDHVSSDQTAASTGGFIANHPVSLGLGTLLLLGGAYRYGWNRHEHSIKDDFGRTMQFLKKQMERLPHRDKPDSVRPAPAEVKPSKRAEMLLATAGEPEVSTKVTKPTFVFKEKDSGEELKFEDGKFKRSSDNAEVPDEKVRLKITVPAGTDEYMEASKIRARNQVILTVDGNGKFAQLLSDADTVQDKLLRDGQTRLVYKKAAGSESEVLEAKDGKLVLAGGETVEKPSKGDHLILKVSDDLHELAEEKDLVSEHFKNLVLADKSTTAGTTEGTASPATAPAGDSKPPEPTEAEKTAAADDRTKLEAEIPGLEKTRLSLKGEVDAAREKFSKPAELNKAKTREQLEKDLNELSRKTASMSNNLKDAYARLGEIEKVQGKDATVELRKRLNEISAENGLSKAALADANVKFSNLPAISTEPKPADPAAAGPDESAAKKGEGEGAGTDSTAAGDGSDKPALEAKPAPTGTPTEAHGEEVIPGSGIKVGMQITEGDNTYKVMGGNPDVLIVSVDPSLAKATLVPYDKDKMIEIQITGRDGKFFRIADDDSVYELTKTGKNVRRVPSIEAHEMTSPVVSAFREAASAAASSAAATGAGTEATDSEAPKAEAFSDAEKIELKERIFKALTFEKGMVRIPGHDDPINLLRYVEGSFDLASKQSAENEREMSKLAVDDPRRAELVALQEQLVDRIGELTEARDAAHAETPDFEKLEVIYRKDIFDHNVLEKVKDYSGAGTEGAGGGRARALLYLFSALLPLIP